MSASIVLDQDFTTYTSLDTISGKVYLRLYKPTNVTGITIKLEGESRTRLLPPATVQDARPKPQLEFHKILYRVTQLLSASNGPARQDGRAIITLPPGTHEYPFSFKVPFNAECAAEKNAAPAIAMAGMSVEIARAPTTHLRRPLPPTLAGYPGMAEIRYYLKATIAQSSMLKQNIRVQVPFGFCPIEPPRPPGTGAETYARIRHMLPPAASAASTSGATSPIQGVSNWARKLSTISSSTSAQALTSVQSEQASRPVEAAVEMRLPEPAILTSNGDLPIRLLITLSTPTPSEHSVADEKRGPAAPSHSVPQRTDIVLSSIHLELVAYTLVRAHNVVRTERESVVLLSKSNMGMPLAFDDKGTAEVPKELWYGLTVPQQLPPSFETCNLTRKYEFNARIGLQSGKGKAAAPQITCDLHLPIQLFSGLAPPPELLTSLQAQAANRPPPLPYRPPSKASISHTGPQSMPGAYPASSHPVRPAQQQTQPSKSSNPPSVTSNAPPVYTEAAPQSLPAPGASQTASGASPWPDAPPSYADVIGDGSAIPATVHVDPNDRRRGYMPPTTAAGEDQLLPSDEKRGWH